MLISSPSRQNTVRARERFRIAMRPILFFARDVSAGFRHRARLFWMKLLRCVACRENDHRHAAPLGTQLAAKIQPIRVRQAEIEEWARRVGWIS